MNEIERAIAYWKEFEAEIDGLYAETNKSGRIELDKQRPAVEVALAALQEREERSKGCEFCNTYDFGRCGIDEHGIFMAGGNSRVDANEQFKFCPRCGRPLKTAMPGRKKMCNHKWMIFGVDENGNYRVCSKCGEKVYIITNADRIRGMSDEELAELFEQIVSQRDHYLLKKLQEAGIDAELYEMPEASKKKHLDWLRQPAGGEQHG